MGKQLGSELIGLNIAWLRQALDLVERIDDTIFAISPEGLAPHRVGSHLRHVVEFYECFLDGFPFARIDYDRRKRDTAIEKDRRSAAAAIRTMVRRLEQLSEVVNDHALAVRMENGDEDAWLRSSFNREMQALSSHTIHHFALIAVTLKLHGTDADPDFGMSPSTLRYQATKSREAA
jgi:phytoene dehydrogenase-like protein